VDTLRADALLDPAGLVNTPNIDALAAEGIIFPNTFAHAPMTLPSFTALFTSRLPFDTGVLNNGQVVPSHYPMVSEWLDKYGYDTRAVISLGTLGLVGQNGVRRGFNEFDARITRLVKADKIEKRLNKSLEDYDGDAPVFLFAHFSDPHEPYHDHDNDPRDGEILVDGEVVGSMSISDPYLFKKEIELDAGTHTVELRSDTSFQPRSVELYRKGKRSGPTWEVGEPLKVTKYARVSIDTPVNENSTYKLRVWMNQALSPEQVQQRYIREVEFADKYIGRFIDNLKRRGLYEDSIIIFTSDHGEGLGERKGFIGHVENLSDPLIHVPLIIRLPKGHPRADELRAQSDALVSHISLVPTILDLLAIPEMPNQKGMSLLGETSGVHLAETHTPEATRNLVCLRDTDYKLVYLADDDQFEMFDLQADPEELTNVFAEKRGERAAWPEQLRSIAALAADRTPREGELSPEVQQQLNALGYSGSKKPSKPLHR
jgi:arylsulfatase A-like enzyme